MLLKPLELAQELDVSVVTVRRLAKQGKIPYLRIGGQYRFDLEQVLSAFKVVAQTTPDPIATYPRQENEWPVHHPCQDPICCGVLAEEVREA